MLYGKRNEIENQRLSGTFYSIWTNAEDVRGGFFEMDDLESSLIGNAYDDLDEAIAAVISEFQDGGALKEYADWQRAEDAELEFAEIMIEQNDLEYGRDFNDGLPVYELFYYPATGQWDEIRR